MTGNLDLGFAERFSEGARTLLRRSRDCIPTIGGNEVAEAVTGARPQDLSDAYSQRPGRRFPTDWHWRIAILAPEPMRAEVAAALVAPLGYGIAPIKPLTAEERLARLEYRVAKRFGEAGAEVVEENRR